jgi:PTH1 family peptidyl-tRNA hydrolase
MLYNKVVIMSEILMIVGLGNPGDEYVNTRHNTGFNALDFFAKSHNFEFKSSKFNALVCKTSLFGKDILLVKPQTFMNKSGEAVRPLAEYFKIDFSNIIVIQDDMDMEVGRVRIKPKGGCGGHNGIRSLIDQLGTEDIKRIKIGIGKPEFDVVDYVLSKFSALEQPLIDDANKKVNSALECVLKQDFEIAMSKYSS